MKSTLIIKKNTVFRYILKHGKYAKGKYIVVHVVDKKVQKDQKINKNYLGICVSKKNGNSVDRNKLKRWAREIYKNEEEKIENNYSIIILYKKNCTLENSTYKAITEDVLKCFKELDLYE